MKPFLASIFIFTTLSSIGQQDSFLEEMKSYSDSICKRELSLKFDDKAGKFGFVDSVQVYIISPQFYCATEFIDCSALVSKQKKCTEDEEMNKAHWYFIGKSKEAMVAPRSENTWKWKNKIRTAPN